MNKLAPLIAVASLVGCQQDTKNIERKLDQIIQKLDKMPAGGGGPGAAGAQAGAQRPQRPEPDRAKTYAVPVDGDPFVGPADAKITLVEAYDYG
jgi:Mg-chelatase subunit ChlD